MHCNKYYKNNKCDIQYDIGNDISYKVKYDRKCHKPILYRHKKKVTQYNILATYINYYHIIKDI